MRRDRRVEALLAAGAEVLGERGVEGCGMREVAARAGVSPATLYRYVQGREELLYRVLERVLERALRSAEAARTRRGPLVQLRTFVTDHVRRVAAFPAEARLLEEGAAGLPHVLARRIEAKRRAYEELACDLVEGICARPLPQRATTLLRTQMLLAMADRLARGAARQASGVAPQRLAQRALALFLDGVRG